ncbi:DUF1996 domain-containing protein [Kibdelosporangium philippinense]|uniref:DUF1996 domain-containing protein n=1 Tax=Kibdelosporangium philippinense TaxID=211113 RepID=A0ABS8ZIE3_9PSEU|nr:DUF1996 domain-containing protein [Kibdelosporangium philippinense]MCE7007574.1 DUF1996 domain-containing protein [Kibdelosporangium philippinense]
MARYSGRHRISRRTKIATLGLGLALAVGGIAVWTTAGDPGQARADLADKSFFVDITTVQPNVDLPEQQNDASTGTFTVDCGKNENEHFNPDNFIAQPGVRNGAQHLHDYVGNLTTNADSNNQSLQAGGTTCKNGDKSAYFWPVIRIEDEEDVAENEQQQQQQQGQDNAGQQQGQENAGQQKQGQNNDAGQNNNQQDNDNADQQQQDQQQSRNRNGGNQNADQDRDGNQRNNLVQQGSLRAAQNQGRDNDQQGDGRQGDRNNRNQNNGDNNDQRGQNNNQQNNNDQQGNEEEAPELDEPNAENELAGNDGEIQRPADVDLQFRGSPVGEVVAMPKFLRILYGDAKVSTNGTKNARDSWTCAGFEDRVLINKYPICPNGAPVKRIHDFPSCWDGENIDSENHRDHIIYPQENGQCKNGFKAVPQLRITLTYNIPQEVQEQGRYKVDSFPEEEHNPFSDHDDFANVMSNQIMNRLVDCVNEGRTCNE